MIGTTHDLQIFNTIIIFFSIFMMHNFFRPWFKFSSDVFFYYFSMLKNFSFYNITFSVLPSTFPSYSFFSNQCFHEERSALPRTTFSTSFKMRRLNDVFFITNYTFRFIGSFSFLRRLKYAFAFKRTKNVFPSELRRESIDCVSAIYTLNHKGIIQWK